MEKVYDIYVGGELYAQNISMEEEVATVERFIEMIKRVDANEHEAEALRRIEDGASVEIVEQNDEPPTWEEYLEEYGGELRNGDIIKMENEGKLKRVPLFEETTDIEHIKTMKYEDFYIDFVRAAELWGEAYQAWIYKGCFGAKRFMYGVPTKQQSFEHFVRLMELTIEEEIEIYLEDEEFITEAFENRVYNE